jgi:phage shock protein C
MICGKCQREIADYSNFCYFCGAPQHAAPACPPRASRRLMRSVVDRKIAGVCGGIAEYLDVDSTLVRLIWVLLLLMPVPVVPAFVGYFVAWIVMPQAPYPMQQPMSSTLAPQSTQTT